MSIARHLDVIELLRAREFPAERGSSGTVTGGPGYHLAVLSTGEEFWEDDGGGRDLMEEQYEAQCAALAERLDGRWGPARLFSLWSVLVRGMEGEEMPEPWYELSGGVRYLRIWRAEDRWIAVGVARWNEELPFQLIAAVTETDPP